MTFERSGGTTMKYTFSQTDVKNIDSFAQAHGIFQQTSYWADFRHIFRHTAFIGRDDSGQTVLTCLLLRLPVYTTGHSIGYITRGFVCDWENLELVGAFTEFLKEYCSKHRIIYIITDPYADYKVEFAAPEPEKDLRAALERFGWVRNDRALLQPKTNYRLLIDRNSDPELEWQRLYGKMNTKLKNHLRLCENRGMYVEKYTGDELEPAVDKFYDMLVHTTEAKGFGRRPLKYYRGMAKALRPFVTVYLHRCDMKKYIALAESQQQQLRQKIAKAEAETDPERRAAKQKSIDTDKKQIADIDVKIAKARAYPEDPYVHADFFIKMGNKSYSFFGASSPTLRELKLTAGYLHMIRDSLDGQCESFNIGGTLKLDTPDIKDDRMYELYLYKCEYAGQFVEHPGEFFLISNEKMFELFHNRLNYFKRIVFRF